MARVGQIGERGAVYVEFILAFFPLFLMFLALCQLALISAADAIVRHAAFSAVRSAVVVLEDDPMKFDGAARGDLSSGQVGQFKGADAVLAKLGITATVSRNSGHSSGAANASVPQQGARMVPIEAAAVLPLLPVAPNEGMGQPGRDTVANSIASTTESQLGFALEYSKAATKVTLHDAPDAIVLAAEPIGSKASVSVRVRYLFHCTVPVVRVMMCHSPERIAKEGAFEVSLSLSKLMGTEARYKLLTSVATLPNQGADYYPRTAP
jgi:hypothetical protein